MSVRAGGQGARVQHFEDHPAVMKVVILQAEQIHHRRADIGVVREEISGFRHTEGSHPGANHTDEGSRDLWLNVSVIPRETGTHKRAEAAGGEEEEVRVAEKGEGRVAIGVRCGTHMQQLLTHLINNRSLEIHAKPGAEQAFRQSGLRINSIEAGHGCFQLPNARRAWKRIALNINGGGIVEVVGERCADSGVRNAEIQIVAYFADPVGAVGAWNVRSDYAIRNFHAVTI